MGIEVLNMANKKRFVNICVIQRALGIIEGVACNIEDESVRQMLYTATEMIEEAVADNG